MLGNYVKLKSVVHIVDIVMEDHTIKHKGKAIRKRLKELPTVDAQEVCRCEHCEYYIPTNTNEGECEFHGITRWYSDYCSDGERRCCNV